MDRLCGDSISSAVGGLSDGYREPGEAYTLVGRMDNAGYLYEVVGVPGAFALLGVGIRARFPKVYVNDRAGSQTAHWLEENAQVEWQQKPLAMWRGQ